MYLPLNQIVGIQLLYSKQFINHVESPLPFGLEFLWNSFANVFILPPLVGFDLCTQFALYKTRIYAVGS